MEALRIGILGLGTVGRGTARLLLANAQLLTQRVGLPLQLVRIATRTPTRTHDIHLQGVEVNGDLLSVVDANDIDVVVELIGGIHPASEMIQRALASGKHVITANKALIAEAGDQIFTAARAAGKEFLFEAAVAGAVPMIKVLRESMAGNRISALYGILNGTCNYILTQMRETGQPFDEVLRQAQALGYAESDPALDVDGIDAAHKLSILAAIAFGTPIMFNRAHIEGIRQISQMDIAWANEMGYRVKLLAIGKWHEEHGMELRVHPTMVPQTSMLAAVDGVYNAVLLEGDYAGTTLYYGRGAGESPTASAVVSDLVDLARNLKVGAVRRVPAFSLLAEHRLEKKLRPMSELFGTYYLRLHVVDKPGVLADITIILKNHGVSIDAFHQKGRSPVQAVPIVIVTHETSEASILAACQEIARLDAVRAQPHMIRIENLNGPS